MNQLTIKQENFCQKYTECGNASEAYRYAYSCGKMKPESINRKAKELLDSGKITARTTELKQVMSDRAIATKEDKLRRLEDIMNNLMAKPTEVIAAIKVHNEMTGDNAPTKTEITGADGSPLISKTAIDLAGLSETQIKEIKTLVAAK